jgi:hypothetical protein
MTIPHRSEKRDHPPPATADHPRGVRPFELLACPCLLLGAATRLAHPRRSYWVGPNPQRLSATSLPSPTAILLGTHPGGGGAGDHSRGVRPPRPTTTRLTEHTNASICA